MKYLKKANGTVVCAISNEDLETRYNLSVSDIIDKRKPTEMSRMLRDVLGKVSKMESDEASFVNCFQAEIGCDENQVIIRAIPIDPYAVGAVPLDECIGRMDLETLDQEPCEEEEGIVSYLLWFHSIGDVIRAVRAVGGNEDDFDSALYKQGIRYALYLHGNGDIVKAKKWHLGDFCISAEKLPGQGSPERMDVIIPANAYKKLGIIG